MKLRSMTMLVTALILSSFGTALAVDWKTYEIRFETAPFYRDTDTKQSKEYRAVKGMQFRKEGEMDVMKGGETIPCWKVSFTNVAKWTSQSLLGSTLLSDTVDRPYVEDGQLYYIAKSALADERYRLVRGPSWGALTLPFKLRTDDGTISGNAALGGFIGYNQRLLFGLHTVLVGAAGLSVISTQDINAKTSDNKTAFTWAVGLAIPIDSSFQAGLFVGADHIGGKTGDDWGHDDKLWISLGIGYAFLQ